MSRTPLSRPAPEAETVEPPALGYFDGLRRLCDQAARRCSRGRLRTWTCTAAARTGKCHANT